MLLTAWQYSHHIAPSLITHRGPVLLLARSASSADRARESVEKQLARLGAEVDPEHVEVVTEPAALGDKLHSRAARKLS